MGKRYTTEYIINLFNKNIKEIKKFRDNFEKKYNIKYYFKDDISFIEWYFKNYNNDEFMVYVKCNKNISDFSFKDDNYIKVTIYKQESNLNYFTLVMGRYSKEYLTKEEAMNDFEEHNKSKLFNLPEILNKNKDNYDSKKFETEDNFCGNYIENNKEYCIGIFFKQNSNIDIYSIKLSGNDDYSIAQDFYSYEESISTWNKLKNKKFVNQSDLPNSYFVN